MLGMARAQGRTNYVAEITARVRKLREAKGWTQAQMALALGVTEEAYRKYEGRTPLPLALVERFALITQRSVLYVITGKDGEPSAPPAPIGRPFRRVKS
jgi:transcriptional regulator with XRE-family HTH domain